MCSKSYVRPLTKFTLVKRTCGETISITHGQTMPPWTGLFQLGLFSSRTGFIKIKKKNKTTIKVKKKLNQLWRFPNLNMLLVRRWRSNAGPCVFCSSLRIPEAWCALACERTPATHKPNYCINYSRMFLIINYYCYFRYNRRNQHAVLSCFSFLKYAMLFTTP